MTQQDNLLLLLIGFASLVLCSCVYVFGRKINLNSFIPWSLYCAVDGQYVQFLVGSLPSFFHVVIFSLAMSFFLERTHISAILCPLVWVVINAFFELGQRYKVCILQMIDEFDLSGFLPFVDEYLINGVFDINDLIMTALGGVLSALILFNCVEGKS